MKYPLYMFDIQNIETMNNATAYFAPKKQHDGAYNDPKQ